MIFLQKITKNKCLEVSLSRKYAHLLSLNLNWRRKQDHAGLFFDFSLLNLFLLEVSLYDNRHWDRELGTWEVYNESGN